MQRGKRGDPFKPITFRLRYPVPVELKALAEKFGVTQTEMLHRLIRKAHTEMVGDTNETL